MKRYQTLLCIGINLTLLSGCETDLLSYNPFSSTPESTSQDSPAPTSKQVSVDLSTIDQNRVLDAVHTQQPLLAYVMALCEDAAINDDIALIPLVTTYYDNDTNNGDQRGIWQLSPTMAQNLSLRNDYWFDGRKDISQSTEAVIAYMKFLHASLEYDWDLAIAAYQVGLQPIADAVNSNKAQHKSTHIEALDIPEEAILLVKNVKAAKHLISNLPKQEVTLKSVEFPGQMDIENLAHVSGISVEEIKHFNGGFKRNLTAPDGPHRIMVRENEYKSLKSVTKDATKLRHISKSNWNYHAVRPNESLSVIAQRFDTSVSELKRVNHLKNDVIQVNQKLLIPEHKTNIPQPEATTVSNHPGPKRILHSVKKQESLYHLSKRYNVSVEDISYWNNLAGKSIKPQQQVTIWQYTPTDTAHFYTVKVNDSLAKIAREHKVSIKSLKDANQLKADIIHPGERLAIPKSK